MGQETPTCAVAVTSNTSFNVD